MGTVSIFELEHDETRHRRNRSAEKKTVKQVNLNCSLKAHIKSNNMIRYAISLAAHAVIRITFQGRKIALRADKGIRRSVHRVGRESSLDEDSWE
jgi:hypothetical protein